MSNGTDALDFAEANPARLVFSVVVGWCFTLLCAVTVIALALVTFGTCWRWLTPLELRLWGRGALAIQGVKVIYEGLEHLEGQANRVALFNHSSGLDAMIVPTLCPRAGVAVVKREVLFVPLVGVALYLMGFVLVDRGRGDRAKRTLGRAAERMKRDQMTVFIAPEGTRSRDGGLQPFKRGAFHLALASRAPIVPVVISGAYALYPRHRWTGRPGTVRVRVLPPISTDSLTVENLPAFAEEVRDLFQKTV